MDCAYVEYGLAGTLAFVLAFVDDLPVLGLRTVAYGLVAATLAMAFFVREPTDVGIFVLFGMLASRSYASAISACRGDHRRR